MKTIESTACLFKSFDVPSLAEIEPEVFVPRSELPPSVLSVEATTLGWDTVNPVRVSEVNRTLKIYDPPPAFDYKIDEKWSISGEFDNWSMVTGGSGSIVFLKTPLKRSKMTFIDLFEDFVFNNGWATIQIKLQYLSEPPGESTQIPEVNEGDPNYLVRNDQPRSEHDPAVVLQVINYGDGKPTPVQDALYKQAIVEYFNNNLSLFTYVFTLVSLNVRAAEDRLQWLKPTFTSYAYFDYENEVSSYFGILNMTDGNSPHGLTNQIAPSAIPNDANASLLISQERFLQKIVLPGLPIGFENASESDFQLSNKNTTIINVRTIRLEDIQVNGAPYTPYLEEFQFQVVGDECQIWSKVKITVFPGIRVYITATSYYRIKLVDQANGEQTLDFEESRAPKTNDWIDKDLGVIITEIILGVIAAVVVVGTAKIVEEILKRIIAIIIIIIVAGLIAAFPEIIGAVMQGKAAEVLPPIGPTVAEATGDIKWPKSSGFKLNSAQLNGSLVLGGNTIPL